MHNPKKVAHEIYLGNQKRKNGSYRRPLLTVWHNDTETDGTDDSCGWFIRSRHLPAGLLDRVIKEFEGEWDSTFTGGTGYVYYTGWFNTHGENVLSVRGIVLNMYLFAAKICLSPDNNVGPGRMWRKSWRFISKHYAEIMYFAENNRDSMRSSIVRTFEIGCNESYTAERRKEMIRNCASIVTTDIMRKLRPWWQHPRWHIHHWQIQFHSFQQLKRRYWDKCSGCGKRGFKGAAYGNWSGNKIWHEWCQPNINVPV